MEQIAVVAHRPSRSAVDCRSCGDGSPRPGSMIRSGTRSRRARRRPKRVRKALEEGAELVLRLGRRRHGAALRRRAGRLRRRARDPARRHGQPPARPTSASRRTSASGARHRRCTGATAPLDVGRGQRRALRGDGRRRVRRPHDRRRRPLEQGAARPAGLRLDRRRRTIARRRATGPRRGRRHDWFEGKASCVLVGNVGTATGGLVVFRRRRARRRRARDRRRHRRGPAAVVRVLVVAGRAGRPTVAVRPDDTRARKIDVRLDTKRRSTSSTAAAATKVKRLKLRSRARARSPCACPTMSTAQRRSPRRGS